MGLTPPSKIKRVKRLLTSVQLTMSNVYYKMLGHCQQKMPSPEMQQLSLQSEAEVVQLKERLRPLILQ